MKRDLVTVGGIYICRVSGNRVNVKILADRGFGADYKERIRHRGFDALNLKTGRRIRVSAMRLRGAALV